MIEITLIALLIGFIYLFIQIRKITIIILTHSQAFGAVAKLATEFNKDIEELKKGDKNGI